MDIAKEITFWIALGIGICALIIAFLWLLDEAVSRIMKSLQIYTDIVEYMWQKRRKKG